MPLALQAYDGGATVPSDLTTCLAAADYQPGTDILVVRRASTTTVAKTDASPPRYLNQPYIQTTPLDYKLDLGSNVATFTLTLPSANNTATVDAPLRRYVVRIYFVAKCNVPSSGWRATLRRRRGRRHPIPTLKMLELGSTRDAPGVSPQFNKSRRGRDRAPAVRFRHRHHRRRRGGHGLDVRRRPRPARRSTSATS
jgi:hypothetical protein